jgi:hypothetical protein
MVFIYHIKDYGGAGLKGRKGAGGKEGTVI